MFKKRLCFRFDKNCNPVQHMQSFKAAQSFIYSPILCNFRNLLANFSTPLTDCKVDFINWPKN